MKVWMEIIAGEHDENLDRISEAIVIRRKELQPIKYAFELSNGNRVKFRNNVRPKYVIGATGTVTSVDGENIKIVLDQPQGRFGRIIIAKASHLEKI